MKTRTFVILMALCFIGAIFALYLIFHKNNYGVECRLSRGGPVKVYYYIGDTDLLKNAKVGDSLFVIKRADENDSLKHHYTAVPPELAQMAIFAESKGLIKAKGITTAIVTKTLNN